MNNVEFVNKAKEIATKFKTLYVMGCFGAPMNNTNKNRYCNNHSYNKQSVRTNKIKNASADTFGFDCVCLIKGILWGWKGDTNKTYGGASYTSNGVPDVGADTIMNYCTDVSKDFSNIQIGEVVHMLGHIGIYIGDGLAVECTPIWKDGVQITAVGNVGAKNGYNKRTWTNHGKLNFIEYSQETSNPTPAKTPNINKGLLDIGTIVTLKDGAPLYYTSNDSEPSGYAKAKKTVITRNNGSKHPYNTTGDLGWMDESGFTIDNSSSNTTTQSRTYIVKSGDTLSGIAKKLGIKDWHTLYNNNKNVIGNNPNLIKPGQVLKY